MNTECSTDPGISRLAASGTFQISSDGGGLLLREVEQRQILRRLSECFIDHRHPGRIERWSRW